jgi:hypothetical protein
MSNDKCVLLIPLEFEIVAVAHPLAVMGLITVLNIAPSTSLGRFGYSRRAFSKCHIIIVLRKEVDNRTAPLFGDHSIHGVELNSCDSSCGEVVDALCGYTATSSKRFGSLSFRARLDPRNERCYGKDSRKVHISPWFVLTAP